LLRQNILTHWIISCTVFDQIKKGPAYPVPLDSLRA